MANGSGCMEIISHLESRGFTRRGAEDRLEWVEEYLRDEALEMVSIEYTFEKAGCEVNREIGNS